MMMMIMSWYHDNVTSKILASNVTSNVYSGLPYEDTWDSSQWGNITRNAAVCNNHPTLD